MGRGENSYDCECPAGYAGSGMGSKGCFDIDECQDGSNKCHPTALCMNLMGSYECRCPDHNGGLLAAAVQPLEACDVPDTKECGDLTSHYILHPDIVVDHQPCKQGKDGEECTFTCANGTSTPVPNKVTCDQKRKMFLDPKGTKIDCVPPADTKCGNLLEMPFATFLLDANLNWNCKKGKESKKGYTEECQFTCCDPKDSTCKLSPTIEEPVEICEVKGKDEIGSARPGAISDFVQCVNRDHYTDCGVVTQYFTFVNGSDAKCEGNSCEFTCPAGFIPTMAGTECLMTKFGGHYDSSGTVSCVPQPPDTACGNVADWFNLVPNQGFKVQPDGTTVFFECYDNNGNINGIGMPAYTLCSPSTSEFDHPKGTMVRCV